MAFGLDAQIIDRLVGDRGGDDLAASDIDADVRGGRALLHFDDGALDLVACTDAHGGPHGVALAHGIAARPLVQDEKPGPPSQMPLALTARENPTLAHFQAEGNCLAPRPVQPFISPCSSASEPSVSSKWTFTFAP